MKPTGCHKDDGMRRIHSCESRSAMTLFELLIAIVIISSLAALLLSAFSAGTRSSMAAKGTGNLRELVQAQVLYAADNNGIYTRLWAFDGKTVWQKRLAPYLGIDHSADDRAFWVELRMNPKSVFNMPDSKPKSQRPENGTSIGISSWIAQATPNEGWNYRTLAVPNPSKIILLGEMAKESNSDTISPPDMGTKYTEFSRGGRTRQLMAFCDGHVEALEVQALYDEAAKRAPGQPNLWHWWTQPLFGSANWR